MRAILIGAIAWMTVGCIEPVQLEWKYDLGAPSVSTPLVTDNYIAVGTAQGLRIVSPRGTLKCSFDKASEVIGAPKTDGELIYFGSTNYILYAVDDSCQERWSRQTRDRIKGDVLVHDGVVYVGSYDRHLYAYDAKTGDKLWMFPKAPKVELDVSNFELSEPEPASAEEAPEAGTVEADASEADGNAAAEEVTALAEPEKPEAKQLEVGAFSYSSPTVANGVLYIGNMDHRLYAIDAKTGEMRWRFKTDAPVTSSPLLVDNVLYFGSNDGNVYAIDVKSLRVLWRTPTQDWVNSSPIVDGNSLYIGANDRRVYSLDTKSGAGKWSFSTKGPAISVPVLYKDLLFAAGGSGDGFIYGIQKASGKLHWKFRTNDKIESDPVVFNKRLFVSSGDGHLYAFIINSTAQQKN